MFFNPERVHFFPRKSRLHGCLWIIRNLQSLFNEEVVLFSPAIRLGITIQHQRKVEGVVSLPVQRQ